METRRIVDIVAASKKDGSTYWKVHTDKGDLNLFDAALCTSLLSMKGQQVSLDIAEKNGFKNIKAALPCAQEPEVTTEKIPAKPAYEPKNLTTMYVSYAKDIFCRIVELKDSSLTLEGQMVVAIQLVKQAKQAFEESK